MQRVSGQELLDHLVGLPIGVENLCHCFVTGRIKCLAPGFHPGHSVPLQNFKCAIENQPNALDQRLSIAARSRVLDRALKVVNYWKKFPDQRFSSKAQGLPLLSLPALLEVLQLSSLAQMLVKISLGLGRFRGQLLRQAFYLLLKRFGWRLVGCSRRRLGSIAVLPLLSRKGASRRRLFSMISRHS